MYVNGNIIIMQKKPQNLQNLELIRWEVTFLDTDTARPQTL